MPLYSKDGGQWRKLEIVEDADGTYPRISDVAGNVIPSGDYVIQKTAVGTYSVTFVANEAGTWYFEWTATGDTQKGEFVVNPSVVI